MNIDPKKLELKPQSILYMPIIECNIFHMGVFILGDGAKIPLHDHPGMTVFRWISFFFLSFSFSFSFFFFPFSFFLLSSFSFFLLSFFLSFLPSFLLSLFFSCIVYDILDFIWLAWQLHMWLVKYSIACFLESFFVLCADLDVRLCYIGAKTIHCVW